MSVVYPKFADNMTASIVKPASLARVYDQEGRFRTLVQSPLRAGILRFLYARPEENFDVEALMTTFGRLRLDVDNCLKELLDFNVIARLPGEPERYAAVEIVDEDRRQQLDNFLER